MKASIIAVLFFALGLVLVALALGQATPDGTRVPPATQIVVPSTTLPGGDVWALGNKDATLAGAFEILKNGVSLGTPRAGQLALCNGEIYAFSIRDGNWWKISGGVWTHTITIPCGVVSAGVTVIPLQLGQTVCTLSVFDAKTRIENSTVWADTPDCTHMKGTTLFKIQSTGNIWCIDGPVLGIWSQNAFPCVRPAAQP